MSTKDDQLEELRQHIKRLKTIQLAQQIAIHENNTRLARLDHDLDSLRAERDQLKVAASRTPANEQQALVNTMLACENNFLIGICERSRAQFKQAQHFQQDAEHAARLQCEQRYQRMQELVSLWKTRQRCNK